MPTVHRDVVPVGSSLTIEDQSVPLKGSYFAVKNPAMLHNVEAKFDNVFKERIEDDTELTDNFFGKNVHIIFFLSVCSWLLILIAVRAIFY